MNVRLPTGYLISPVPGKNLGFSLNIVVIFNIEVVYV